jgi:hypothetical protein
MTALFASFTNTTAANIQATEDLILDLQRELEAARQQLASFQQQQQIEMTASGAAASALEATAKAFKAVFAAYGEQGVEEFKQALCDLAGIQAPTAFIAPANDTDPQPEVVVPTAPVEPTNEDVWASDDSDNTAIETTAVVVDEDDYVDPEENLPEQKEDTSESIAELDFSGLTWVQIKKLAQSYGLDINRRKRPHLEKALSDIGVTQAEIDQFLKG